MVPAAHRCLYRIMKLLAVIGQHFDKFDRPSFSTVGMAARIIISKISRKAATLGGYAYEFIKSQAKNHNAAGKAGTYSAFQAAMTLLACAPTL